MLEKILNLPCGTSAAVHRSVMDLQNLNTENNEADGEVGPIRDNNKKTGSVQAQKMMIRTSIGIWVR